MMMVLSVCAFYSSYPHLTLTDCTGTPKSECGDPAGVEDPTACGSPPPEAVVYQQRCSGGVGSSTSEDDDYITTNSITTTTNVCECVDSPHSKPRPLVSATASVMAERARGGRPDSPPEAWPSKGWHGDVGVDELADGQVVMYERESISAEFVAGIIEDDEQDDEACLKIDETYVETDFDDNDSEAVVEVVCETTPVENGGLHDLQMSPGRTHAPQSQTEGHVTPACVTPGSCVVQLVAREQGAGQHEDVHLSDCPHAVDLEHEVMCRFRKRKSESFHGHHPACRSCRRVNESGAVDARYYSGSSGEETFTLVAATAPGVTGVATEEGASTVLTETSVLVLDVCAASSSSTSTDYGAVPCEADPQQPDFPLATCLPCCVDAVPMVALECELPVSGRLSPPVDDGSVAFLPMGSDLHTDAVLEVAVSDSGEVGEDHFSVTSRGPGLKRKRHQRNDCEEESFDVCDEQCVNSSQLRDRACHDQADPARRGSHKKRRVDGRCLADKEERDQNCDMVMEEEEVPDTTTTTADAAAVVALVQDPPDSTDPTSTAECEDSLLASSSVTSGFKLPRISPFHNTPKQRKEERRRILKLSIHKMRAVEDPEHFLRRSVLINNTMKRLQRELREEKLRGGPRRAAAACYSLYRHRGPALHYDVLNNSYLLHDEAFAVSEHDRITDDMTDALVTRLEATSTVSSTTSATTTSAPVAMESAAAAMVCDSDDVFAVSPLLPDTTSSSTSSSPPSPSSSCSSESQRGKQFFSDMDVVFNNLIRALGES